MDNKDNIQQTIQSKLSIIIFIIYIIHNNWGENEPI